MGQVEKTFTRGARPIIWRQMYLQCDVYTSALIACVDDSLPHLGKAQYICFLQGTKPIRFLTWPRPNVLLLTGDNTQCLPRLGSRQMCVSLVGDRNYSLHHLGQCHACVSLPGDRTHSLPHWCHGQTLFSHPRGTTHSLSHLG